MGSSSGHQRAHEYQNPNRHKSVEEKESDGSSTDSDLERLREPDLPKDVKRRGEVYEVVTLTSSKRKKRKYLHASTLSSADNVVQKLDFAAPRMVASYEKRRPRSTTTTLAPIVVAPVRHLISPSFDRPVLLSPMRMMNSTRVVPSSVALSLPSQARLHIPTALVWPQLPP